MGRRAARTVGPGLALTLLSLLAGVASGQQPEGARRAEDVRRVDGATEAAALRAFRSLAEEARPGTRAHRRAAGRLFAVRVSEAGGAPGAEAVYREFLRLYPEADGEAAAMAGDLALAWAQEGHEREARRVLEEADLGRGSVRAPIERARGLLALWAGRPAEAAARLREAAGVPGAAPGERTGWIELLAALETADSAEAAIVGRALGGLRRDPSAGGPDALLADLSAVPAGEGRPALLALAARGLDEAGRPAEAADLRRHLVRRHPESAEAPLAMLEIGRGLREEDPGEARSWLERLVVEHPGSAVSPLARRLLAEMTSRAPGSP